MSKTQAEFFANEIKNRGRGAHTEQLVRNLNGYAVVLSEDGETTKRLMQIEEAKAFIAEISGVSA